MVQTIEITTDLQAGVQYIALSDEEVASTEEFLPHVIVDLDAQANVAGVERLNLYKSIPWGDLFKQFRFPETARVALENLGITSERHIGMSCFDTQPDSSITLPNSMELIAA